MAYDKIAELEGLLRSGKTKGYNNYIDYNDPENKERLKLRLEGKDPFFNEWDELPAGDRWDGMDAEDRWVHLHRM